MGRLTPCTVTTAENPKKCLGMRHTAVRNAERQCDF